MANRVRGEVEGELDGRVYVFVLTLGALAELEAAFGDTDMLALAERFSRGRLSATDTVRILGAGLRGAGNDIQDSAVATMRSATGATGYVDIVARLLAATFGPGGEGPTNAAAGGGKDTGHPFPGGR